MTFFQSDQDHAAYCQECAQTWYAMARATYAGATFSGFSLAKAVVYQETAAWWSQRARQHAGTEPKTFGGVK